MLCTGNAARSVMAAFMLEHFSEADGLGLIVASAGTHTVDGQPMSLRTREALTAIPELADAPVGRHRSRQLGEDHLEEADLVVAMEADHIRFVRARHPAAAARTGSLRHLASALASGPGPLGPRVAALDLAALEPDRSEDVTDPAGQEAEVYRACALELWRLTGALAARIGGV
jgi:protein-tyrosine-phosphatase